MERLTPNEKRPSGINGNALRTWALLFLAAGIIGRGVIQGHLLGISGMSAAGLLEVMGASEDAMMMTTLSIVLQALEACAAPLFALMLVTGAVNTSDLNKYLLRVAGLALLCEIPYNFAFSAKLLDMSSRNPVFAMALCLVMIWFFLRYSAKGLGNTLIRIMVVVVSLLWVRMLKIDSGACMVLLVAVMWVFRAKPVMRNFAGASVAMMCTVISPLYLFSPMAFLIVHGYNGEESTHSQRTRYLAYPVMLLLAGAVGVLL